MKEKIDIESLSHRTPYRVPDGYFSELNHKILERTIESEAADEHFSWRSFLRLSGFAFGFAALVLVATFSLKLITPGNIADKSLAWQDAALQESTMLSMYEITTDDIIDDMELTSNYESINYTDQEIEQLLDYETYYELEY